MKILFVCTGNTCRSPMAEGLFRQLLAQRGAEASFACASAGLSTTRAGGISSLFDREEIEKKMML